MENGLFNNNGYATSESGAINTVDGVVENIKETKGIKGGFGDLGYFNIMGSKEMGNSSFLLRMEQTFQDS